MRKYVLTLAALLMMGTASVMVTSCGDDEATPEQRQEEQKPLMEAEAKALLEEQCFWEFVDEESFHFYFYFSKGKMGAFSDDTTPSEVDYNLASESGDFRSGTVRMMKGETLLEEVSYRGLSASSVTLEMSEGTWVTYKAYQEKTPQGVQIVDLGLPSGTLWATCNVGATKPEAYGDYFAWAETKKKDEYTWENYKWGDGTDNYTSANFFSKYANGDDELEPQDDAAYANWGAGWCMPSQAQCEELINTSYTTMEAEEVNGIMGIRITSKIEGYTDKSFFLPAAGVFQGTPPAYATGSNGFYWSRTINPNSQTAAKSMNLPVYARRIVASYQRQYGRSVRPVRRLPKVE